MYKLGSGGSYSTSIPTATAPGTYTIYYKIFGDSNHNDSAEKSIQATIEPPLAAYTAPTPKENLIYTGSALELLNPGSSNEGTVKYSSTSGGTYSTSIPTATAAGSHTVYFRVDADANHTSIAPIAIQVNIAKATPEVTGLSAKDNLIYTGSAQTLISAGTASGGTLQYSLNGGSYSTTVPSATDAGTYVVSYRVVGDSNYNSVDPVDISVTIAKKDASWSTEPSAKAGLIYSGSNQELLSSAGTAVGGTAEYSMDNSVFSINIASVFGNDAGSYTVYWRIDPDSNHNAISGSLSTSISKATVSDTVTAYTAVYDGQVHKPSISNIVVTSNSDVLPTNLSLEFGSGNFTDVSTYDFTVKVTGDPNFNDYSKDLSYSITKATSSWTTLPQAKTGLVYSGSAHILLESAGTAVGGTATYQVTGDFATSMPTATNAGTYTVSYMIVGDDNHNDSAVASLTVTIARADYTVTVTPKYLTYTGSPQELVTFTVSDNAPIRFSLDGISFGEAIPVGTDFGTYTVHYEVDGGTNYNSISGNSVTVQIAKRPVEFTAASMSGYVYGSTPSTPSSTTSPVVSVTYYYYTAGNLDLSNVTTSATVWSGITSTTLNAGSYYIYMVSESNDNYSQALRVIPFTVEKAPLSWTTLPAAKTDLVYDGSDKALIDGGTVPAVFTAEYSLSSDTGFSGSVPTGSDAGTYTIYYRITTTNTNYVGETSVESMQVTIAKATPVFTVSAANLKYTGDGVSRNLVSIEWASNTPDAVKDNAGVMYRIGATNQVQDGTTTEYGASIPTGTNAGFYMVYYKATGNDNINPVQEGSVVVNYNKADTAFTAVSMSGYTYGQTAAIPQPSCNTNTDASLNFRYSTNGNLNGSNINTATAWNNTSSTALNAGTYYMYILAGETYNYTAGFTVVEFVVSKGTPEWTTLPAAKTGLAYTSSELELISAGAVTTGCTAKYKVGTSSYGTSIPKGINAGSYTVSYYIEGNDNYNDLPEASLTVSIAKASPAIQITPNVLSYTGNSQTLLTYSITPSDSNLQFKIGSGEYAAASSANLVGTAAGDYIVYYKVIGDSNHNEVEERSITVTISNAAITISSVSAPGFVYGTSPSAPTSIATSAIGSSVSVAYYCSDSPSLTSIAGATPWGSLTSTTLNAGTYYVYAYATAVDHTPALAKSSFVVSQAQSSWSVSPGTVSLTYNGSSQPLLSAGTVVEGQGTAEYWLASYTDNIGSATIDYAESYGAMPSGTAAGKYVVYYRIATQAGSNYAGLETQSATVVISKADADFTVVPVANLSYDQLSHNLVSPSWNDSSFEDAGVPIPAIYRIGATGSYGSSIPSATDAGSYIIYYKVDASNNFNALTESSVTATIGQSSAIITGLTMGSYTYAGSFSNPTASCVSPLQFFYSTKSDVTDPESDDLHLWHDMTATSLNAGSYHMYAYAPDTANTSATLSTPVPFTVSKATPVLTVTGKVLTYNGEEQELITYTVQFGTTDITDADVQFALGEGAYGTSVPKAVNAGDYTVRYRIVESTNYVAQAVQTTDVITIARANTVWESEPAAVEGLVYNSEDHQLIVAGAAIGGTPMYKITYSGNEPPAANTDPVDGFSPTLPKGNGAMTYRVCYYISADSNHNDSAKSYVDVIISKADSTVSIEPTAATSLVYTGHSQRLIVEGECFGGNFVYSSTENGEYVAAVPTEQNAGTYSVWYYVRGDSNHNDTEKAHIEGITIAKANSVWTSAPHAKTGLVFNDSGQELLVAGTTSDGTPMYRISEYTTSDVGSFAENVPTGRNAGLYIVECKIVGDDNHNDLITEVETTIDRQSSVVTVTANVLAYTGGDQELVGQIQKGSSDVTILFMLDDDEEWSDTLPTGKDAGTYTVYYMAENSTNYYGFSGRSVTAIIDKVPVVVPLSSASPVYNASAQPLVTVTEPAPEDKTYASIGYRMTASGDYGASIPTGQNAGSYKVYYKVTGDRNHYDAEGSIDVVISKATLTVTIEPKVLTYTTQAQELITYVVKMGDTVVTDVQPQFRIAAYTNNGFDNNDQPAAAQTETYPESVRPYGAAIPTGTDSGYYAIYYKVNETTNYNAVQEASIVAPLARALNAFISVSMSGYTYGQTAALPQPSCTTAGLTNLEFRYSQDGSLTTSDIGSAPEWEDMTSTSLDAGKWYMYVKADETNNYVEGFTVVTFTVNQAPNSWTALPQAQTGLSYNGNAQELLSAAGTSVGGTPKYSLDNSTWYDSKSSITTSEVGDYPVYYRIDGGTNYHNVDVQSMSVTISKATPTGITVTAQNHEYNGSPQDMATFYIPQIPLAGGCTVEFSVNGGDWSSTPSGTDAGEYTVTYKIVGGNNYNSLESEDYVVYSSISPIHAMVSVAPVPNLTYIGSSQELVTSAVVSFGIDPIIVQDAYVEYSIGNGWSDTIPTATAAGDYTVHYRMLNANNGNFYDLESDIVVTMARATPDATLSIAGESQYSKVPNPTLTTNSDGSSTLYYSADSIADPEDIVSNAAVWNPNAVNALVPGTYYVYATISDGMNYEAITRGPVQFEIIRADLSASIDMATKFTEGDAISPGVRNNLGGGEITSTTYLKNGWAPAYDVSNPYADLAEMQDAFAINVPQNLRYLSVTTQDENEVPVTAYYQWNAPSWNADRISLGSMKRISVASYDDIAALQTAFTITVPENLKYVSVTTLDENDEPVTTYYHWIAPDWTSDIKYLGELTLSGTVTPFDYDTSVNVSCDSVGAFRSAFTIPAPAGLVAAGNVYYSWTAPDWSSSTITLGSLSPVSITPYGSFEELQNGFTTSSVGALTAGDIVKVNSDSNHSNLASYYSWAAPVWEGNISLGSFAFVSAEPIDGVTTAPPTAPGIYTVTMVIAESQCYTGQTLTLEFEIVKRPTPAPSPGGGGGGGVSPAPAPTPVTPDKDDLVKTTEVKEEGGKVTETDTYTATNGDSVKVTYDTEGDNKTITNTIEIAVGEDNTISDKVVDMANEKIGEINEASLNPHVVIKSEGETTVPSSIIEKVTEGEGTLTYTQNSVTVTFPAKTLSDLGLNESGSTLSIVPIPMPDYHAESKKSDHVYDITISSEQGSIHDDFTQPVLVKIPFVLSPGKDISRLSVFYLGEDFEVAMEYTYDGEFVSFYAPHFSVYTLVYDEEYVPIIDPETAEDLGLVIAIIVAVLGAIDLLILGYWYYRRS